MDRRVGKKFGIKVNWIFLVLYLLINSMVQIPSPWLAGTWGTKVELIAC